MVTYSKSQTSQGNITTVLLEGKPVGKIKKMPEGYRYFPYGSRTGELPYKTINEVKKSLEEM